MVVVIVVEVYVVVGEGEGLEGLKGKGGEVDIVGKVTEKARRD